MGLGNRRKRSKFVYMDYNKEFFNELDQKGYITRADEEWLGKGDNKLFSTQKEHIITGCVKQVKE